MSIIAYKNNLINYDEFIKQAYNTSYIDGIIIPVIMTEDEKIIVFDDQATGTPTTEVLQKSTVDEIISGSVFKLSDFLERIKDINKRVIINIYPLYLITLSDETVQYVNQQNTKYVNLINDIIKNYPKMDISLCTVNRNLLQLIKQLVKEHKKGLIIIQGNLSYIDVDFYVLSPTMIDAIIIKQELDLGKEVMIYSITGNDLAMINSFFKKDLTKLKNELFIKLTFITAYPNMFYELLYKK